MAWNREKGHLDFIDEVRTLVARVTADQFTQIAKHAFQQLVADKINERLKGAMTPEPTLLASVPHAETDAVAAEILEPMSIEVEAYQIVRAHPALGCTC